MGPKDPCYWALNHLYTHLLEYFWCGRASFLSWPLQTEVSFQAHSSIQTASIKHAGSLSRDPHERHADTKYSELWIKPDRWISPLPSVHLPASPNPPPQRAASYLKVSSFRWWKGQGPARPKTLLSVWRCRKMQKAGRHRNVSRISQLRCVNSSGSSSRRWYDSGKMCCFCIYRMSVRWRVVMRVCMTINDSKFFVSLETDKCVTQEECGWMTWSAVLAPAWSHSSGCRRAAARLTWFFKSSLGQGRPLLKAFSLSHLERICNPLPQEALQADQADQSLSLQSRGQGMWQTSTT